MFSDILTQWASGVTADYLRKRNRVYQIAVQMKPTETHNSDHVIQQIYLQAFRYKFVLRKCTRKILRE